MKFLQFIRAAASNIKSRVNLVLQGMRGRPSLLLPASLLTLSATLRDNDVNLTLSSHVFPMERKELELPEFPTLWLNVD